jgi:tRNA A-37 threonylcarbamoyl transferase component Bud32
MRNTPGSTKMTPAMAAQHKRSNAAHYVERNERAWGQFAAALEKLGLTNMDGVKSYRGKVIKNHKGSRDVLRIPVTDLNGHARTLYLKRTWKSYKKDGLFSLLQHGRVWSVSRREWENSKTLNAAGLKTADLIAFGEECGPLWEKFSYILTAEAAGTQTLGHFLQSCPDPAQRRRVLDALALEIRKMHDAGLASPDLFTRHIFVNDAPAAPTFCLIDMARLDRRRSLSTALCARDLAALNITAPLRHMSGRERLRFLTRYSAQSARTLLPLIHVRVNHLLRRRKFRDYSIPSESKKKPAPGLNTSPRSTTPEIEATHTHSQP